MSSVNKVILCGKLGADPEIRYRPTGEPVATMRVATSERWTNADGERKEHTEWHTVIEFRKSTIEKYIVPYLKKGLEVYVEGRNRTRSYDKDGIKRYTTEIIASDVQLNGNRPDAGKSDSNTPNDPGGDLPPGDLPPADLPPASDDKPFA
ncbi:single-stranded DNA-binding protein [Cupriavidus malaysiensis]|uniref:Single-stranded DNA-binding protein n=1 Tax=Cupriavidus malaysiensis TaxID=367825 RepID=A0ABN4TYZ8_9BURK|nr:single-stranded DNA-binding protein [Cupriavidus malaysiensis]AOZ11180.1 hypothetical protein BKK80_35090 [Cupriavidus malaysiensis]